MIHRRQVLTAIALGSSSVTLAKSCLLTPKQPEGPFYPQDIVNSQSLDLTSVVGQVGTATGEIIKINGRVANVDCQPIANTRIEIWQANHFGRYNHPLDGNNEQPLDPFFKGDGVVVTDANGNYEFTTIMPGQYAAGEGWVRPPHIHFKIVHPKYRPLITQMYFSDHEELQAKDYLLKSVKVAQRKQLITQLKQQTSTKTKQLRQGTFDIVLA